MSVFIVICAQKLEITFLHPRAFLSPNTNVINCQAMWSLTQKWLLLFFFFFLIQASFPTLGPHDIILTSCPHPYSLFPFLMFHHQFILHSASLD